MNRYSSTLATLTAMLFTAMSPACAATVPPVDAQAAGKQVVKTWIDGVRAAKMLSAEVAAEVAVKKDGEVVETDVVQYRLAVEKPQHFAMVVVDGEGVAVVNNEKQLYEYASEVRRYQMTQARTTVADVLSSKVLGNASFGQGVGLLAEALSNDSIEKVFEKLGSVTFVGDEVVDGVKAKRVRLVRGQIPTDYWFTADSSRLLKLAPDLMAALAAKGKTPLPGMEIQLAVAFKHWSYDSVPAGSFNITPQSDAELVDDLFAEPPHPLVGKPAPQFETVSLDGKPIKLADLAGKVVVLDFWATWCAPCVEALPLISATAKKFEDRGVVFYAVNQGEEPSIIKEFLESQELKVPVALDLERNVAIAFGIEVLPQTVIIDKQGKVQAVHLGAGPDIGEQLTKEIDAVLAGKDLSGKKPTKQETK